MPLDMTSSDTYDTPDSSPDPYDTSSPTSATTNGLPSHIDLSSLPSGLPILGPLTGYTTARQAARLRKELAQMSDTVRRPLTQSEQTAMVYYTAKGFAIASYGPTIGIGAGVYQTYATRAQFRWPMYGKMISDAPAEGEVQKGFWDGQKMRAGGKEILQGVSSQAKANILHVSRGFAYCLIGAYLAPLFVSSYAATVSAVGEVRDPRLHEVNKAVREAVLRDQRQKKERGGEIVKQTDARREGRMPNFPRERDQGRGRRGGGAEVDDASPTGGAMMDMGIDEEQGRLSGAGDMGGMLSDGQMRSAEAKAMPPPSQTPAGNRAATFQMEKVERQPKDFGSDFDDASPTGGSGAMDGGDGSAGSVWERIRQQSSSEPSGSSMGRGRGMRGSGMQQEQQEGSTTGDSFSFSNSDEERSYAKIEAQREFDERVEKERRGGEFNSGGGRRW
ncbi:hypothetical protein HO133_006989 [Letharia lupina]|uniref:Uncharacterized protein n=1 Tax=Letharia lupina TaxID=560253 RepID=A0A8H6CSS8_9LECA|nr:uncharacterized protein HO133_006989 [Letharia lupina]KAF6228878.1 hypothetical protein HO133_006989 [Letharia lupina]